MNNHVANEKHFMYLIPTQKWPNVWTPKHLSVVHFAVLLSAIHLIVLVTHEPSVVSLEQLVLAVVVCLRIQWLYVVAGCVLTIGQKVKRGTKVEILGMSVVDTSGLDAAAQQRIMI